MKLKIGTIQIIGLNPRTVNPKDPEVLALAESIKKNGQQIEIIVNRPSPNEACQLIDGERRLTACRLAGLSEIEAVVKENLSRAEMQKINALSNQNREPLTPIQKAIEAKKLIKEFGPGNEDMAAAVLGIPKQEMKLLANLENLSPRWLETIKRDGPARFITIKHLTLIARLPAAVQESQAQEIYNHLTDWNRSIMQVNQFAAYLQENTRVISSFPFDTASCLKCDRTSAGQRELFPEIADEKGTRCLDGACSQKKLDTFVLKAAADAKGEHGKKLRYVGLINRNDKKTQDTFGDLEQIYREEELKPADQKDEKAFPVIFLKGSAAGKVLWRKHKRPQAQENADGSPRTAADRKGDAEHAKKRRKAIDEGKALIAAIDELIKTGKDKLRARLEKDLPLSQRIVLTFGTEDNDLAAGGAAWKHVFADKGNMSVLFGARALAVLLARLERRAWGRPGDLNWKDFYGEAIQMAKLAGMEFLPIYAKHAPAVPASNKEPLKAAKKADKIA